MILSPDQFKGREACQIWLRLPIGEIGWFLEEIYFGDGFLNINLWFHVSLNCTLEGGSQQLDLFFRSD